MKLIHRKPNVWLWLSLVLCFLLTACNPAPKYARPPAAAPTAFKEAVPEEYKEGAGWKLAQPGDDKLRGKWWELYKDPQLSTLEEQVAVSNQSIALAEANFRAARSLVAYARASLFPTVTTSPGYTRSQFSRTSRGATVVGGAPVAGTGTTTGTGTSTGTGTGTGTTGTGTTGTGNPTSSNSGVGGTSSTGILNNFTLPFSASYEVDLWHRIRNTIAANAFQAEASAADIANATLSTQAEVAQDYFEIRALDAQRQILRETIANYRESLELTNARFRGGIASDEDVSQAQTQLDLAIAQETDFGVSRATFEHAIATLIGKAPANFALAPAPFVPNPPEVPVAVPSELLERRPDIAGSERQVAAANAEIGVARAAYYPRLSLSATAGFQTSNFNQWFTWPSNFWSLGPSLGQVLFDAGARRSLTEQAKANYDATVATYRQTVLTAFEGVENYLSALRILSTEIGQQHTAVTSASHYLDLSLVRYRGGVDSYLNVITAQNSVLTSRETEVQIQLRQMSASVSLIMALGGGWDASQLPSAAQLTSKQPKTRSQGTTTPDSAPQPLAAPNPPPLPAEAKHLP
ncbi:MAG: efflux transporter outer membrane subunit [Bryobacteraceae bacterium]